MTAIQSNLSWSTIDKIADSIANQVNYNIGDDLKAIVKKMGGEIPSYDYGRDMESLSLDVTNNKFKINLQVATGPLRDRFDIAHNIGHYVLHYLYRKQHLKEDLNELKVNRFSSAPEDTQADREANCFARSFLMPTKQYTKYYEEFKGDHSKLSYKFKVSRMASETRAKSLGLMQLEETDVINENIGASQNLKM